MVWTPKGNEVFVSSDGDNIGSHVAAALLSGNVARARKLSLLINLGGKLTDKFAKSSWKGKTIILGGDDLMIQTSKQNFNPAQVEEMRKLYHSKIKATLSCGVGSTPEEAMKAIVIAKNTGKNKSVFWTDDMEPTYKKVVKDRLNTLQTKLRAAGGKVMESQSLDEASRMKLGSKKATSSGNIPDDLKAHVRSELRRLLKQRKKRNQAKAPAKKPAASKYGRPAFKKPGADKAAQEKKQKAIANHQPQAIEHMKKFILQHNYDRRVAALKAHKLHLMGHDDEARAIRTLSKLKHQKMLRDHNVLHTAAQLRDPAHLPPLIKKQVAGIRNRMATAMKATRKMHRETAKLKLKMSRGPLGQLKSKPADRQLSGKKFRVARGQLHILPFERQLGAKLKAPHNRVKPVAHKPPAAPKPVHPAHTPEAPKHPKVKKPPALAPKPFNKNKPYNKFKRRK